MSALTNFLLNRIAEDEEAAEHFKLASGTDRTLGFEKYLEASFSASRIEAECHAKRQIVSLWRDRVVPDVGREATGYESAIWDVLTRMAVPYAGHADYSVDWRPNPTRERA